MTGGGEGLWQQVARPGPLRAAFWRAFKGNRRRQVLWLCDRVIANARLPTVPPGERRGLPIGNLTSQFWANVYLDPLDHLVRDDLHQGACLR